jgi:hypothetical protein
LLGDPASDQRHRAQLDQPGTPDIKKSARHSQLAKDR